MLPHSQVRLLRTVRYCVAGQYGSTNPAAVSLQGIQLGVSLAGESLTARSAGGAAAAFHAPPSGPALSALPSCRSTAARPRTGWLPHARAAAPPLLQWRARTRGARCSCCWRDERSRRSAWIACKPLGLRARLLP